MNIENILRIGDVSDNGQVTIVDEDRLCYLVKSESRGSVGLRTISKALLGEYVYYFTENPESITHKKRTVEREFQFYMQVQKRNGFYKALGLTHLPLYRADYLYVPFMLNKRGLNDTIKFFKLWWYNSADRKSARMEYLKYLKG